MSLESKDPYRQQTEIDGFIFNSLLPELPYRIEGKKGGGSFSNVLRVQSEQVDARGNSYPEMALKINDIKSDNFNLYFRELYLGRLPVNPFIVVPDNVFWTKAKDYVRLGIIYELFDGDLTKWGRGIPKEERLRLALDSFDHLVQAIYFLLDNGIFHYDIKPGNILYREKNGKMIVKIADFGLISPAPCLSSLSLERNYRRFPFSGAEAYQPQTEDYDFFSMFESLALTMIGIVFGNYSMMSDGSVFDENPSDWAESEEDKRALEYIFLLGRGKRPPLPPRQQASYLQPTTKEYSTWDEVKEKIKDYYYADEEENVYDFLHWAWKELMDIKYGNVINTTSVLEFIRLIDCLSRYLKKYPYTESLVPNLIALLCLENHMEYPFPFHPADLVDLVIKLDFNVIDCDMSEAFFCLKDDPLFPLEGLLEKKTEIFSNPIQTVLTYLKTVDPTMKDKCQDLLGYENLKYPPAHYQKGPSIESLYVTKKD